jgi:DNA-binding NtrC family response regulator
VERSAQYVLVVDDDASIRLLCRINLELAGWSVREAATIAEARERLADHAIDVVLLDVMVGTDSGVAFLEELRRDYPETPVAMLTGWVDAPTTEGDAVDAVLTKPFTLEGLVETVQTLAEGRKTGNPAPAARTSR